MLGYFARISAAAPATMAHDMLVPYRPVSYVPPGSALTPSTPGAHSVSGAVGGSPGIENDAWLPLRSTLQTAITPGKYAGASMMSRPLPVALGTAATKTTSASSARLTAAATASVGLVPNAAEIT